jgi:cytochrome c biogenesis protein CcmG/thiol:disulfide interchange protein DsbE
MRRALAAGTILFLLTSCSSSGGDIKGPSPIPAHNATRAPLLPTEVLALPETSFDRFQQLLEQLHGTPVVVNIWGSWCGPCREEGPRFAQAAKRYGRQIQFIGVDVKDVRDSAQAFIQEMGWTYPSLFDPTESIKTGLGFLGVPDTLFFDASGKRVAVSSGPMSADDLAANIHKILP